MQLARNALEPDLNSNSRTNTPYLRRIGSMPVCSLRSVFCFLLSIFLFSSVSVASKKVVPARPKLTIYTYDSFVSKYGPGPFLESSFEMICACEIEWVSNEDGAALVNRLRLEGKNAKADLVVGIDGTMVAQAQKLDIFAPVKVDLTSKLALPVPFDGRGILLPFDYGILALMYDSKVVENPPKSWSDFLNNPKWHKSLIIEDPRTSSVGLGLMFWFKLLYGDKANLKWKELHAQVLAAVKGWSAAYGMFMKGESSFVLSYTTSELYHRIQENSDRYRALVFTEGHYLQIETAGVIKTSKNQQLAESFLRFMLEPESQRVIALNNWMYPVLQFGNISALPKEFVTISQPAKLLTIDPAEASSHRDAWVAEWLASFR